MEIMSERPEAEKGGIVEPQRGGVWFFFEGSSARNLSIAVIPGQRQTP